MMQRIKHFIVAAIVITAILTPVVITPAAVSAANPLDNACSKLSDAQQKEATACTAKGDTNPIAGPDGIINKIAAGVAVVAGAIAVIIIIVQGIRMITSAGDAQNFAKARSGVLYALVGLVIIVLAKALITFVVNRL
jgi:type IV secretory pathway VirB2 component (pilin)